MRVRWRSTLQVLQARERYASATLTCDYPFIVGTTVSIDDSVFLPKSFRLLHAPGTRKSTCNGEGSSNHTGGRLPQTAHIVGESVRKSLASNRARSCSNSSSTM